MHDHNLHIVSYLYCQMGYQENELGICRANAKNSRKNSRTDNSKLEFILCDCKCTRLLLMEVPMRIDLVSACILMVRGCITKCCHV